MEERKTTDLGALLKHPISALRQVVPWETRDGRKILLKDIPDNHLQNIIRFLRNETAGEKGERLRTLNNWLDVTRREQDYRRKLTEKHFELHGDMAQEFNDQGQYHDERSEDYLEPIEDFPIQDVPGMETVPAEPEEEPGALTWEELANIYDKHHSGSRPARTLPMETVYDWACRMTTLFEIKGPEGTIHLISTGK